MDLLRSFRTPQGPKGSIRVQKRLLVASENPFRSIRNPLRTFKGLSGFLIVPMNPLRSLKTPFGPFKIMWGHLDSAKDPQNLLRPFKASWGALGHLEIPQIPLKSLRTPWGPIEPINRPSGLKWKNRGTGSESFWFKLGFIWIVFMSYWRGWG